MKLQTLKNNNMTCTEYINLLINKGYKTVAEAMEKDKKAEGGMVNFVLIEKIGKVIVKPLSVSEVVKKIKKYDLYNFAE